MPDLDIIIYTLKTFFISGFIFYTFFKLINEKIHIDYKIVLIILANVFIASLCSIIKYYTDSFMFIMTLFLLNSLLLSTITKKQISNTMIITLISLGINYVILLISSIISFFPNEIFNIEINLINDLINLFFMLLIHVILLYSFFKIKRFKNGFTFLQRKNRDEHFDALILNMNVAVLFAYIILTNYDNFVFRTYVLFGLIIFALVMYLSIKNSLTLYYKQKLLKQELENSNLELEKAKNEYSNLEKENLSFMKITHSIKHKLEALEYKSNSIIGNCSTEINEEISVVNKKIKDTSKDYFNQIENIRTITELPKTGIEDIDDMFSYMNSECNKNNIDFNLQLNGNIHFMINNIITTSLLETLIADHIKNSIIAISFSNNELNRSIIVKLGLFDSCYKLCIYDTGIEFEIDTLINLGLKAVTTHSNSGGTGIGFMNTFETLKECKSSLIIEEKQKPSDSNYTKAVIIRFDGKDEYKVYSYRADEIKKVCNDNRIIIKSL